MSALPSDRAPRRFIVWFYALAVAAILVAIAVTIVYLGPVPPRVVVMTTGTSGSAYEQFGRRYQAILAESGVELRLMPSAGSVENLQRLRDPGGAVSVGFAQGGLTSAEKAPSLVSLGTLCYEPFWIFFRSLQREHGARSARGNGRRDLDALRGKKIAVGPEGSGTRALALRLLAINGVDESFARLLPITGTEAADKLLRGEIDAVFIITASDAPAVQQLLAAPDVRVANFKYADAYVALYPFIDKVVLPAGVSDMVTLRPSADVTLLAPKVSLVARDDLHPAIQYLLLDAASQVHSGSSIFRRPGQFPAPEAVDLPLSKEAQRFYKSGAPFLQRYLPFWLSVLAVRALVLLIPIIGIAYPLLRLAPTIYGWSMRRRIFRLYGELKFIELGLQTQAAAADMQRLLERLDRLEARANHLRVPVSFSQLLYTLRHHIELVRARDREKRGSIPLSPLEPTAGS